jgi:hypothetical protein
MPIRNNADDRGITTGANPYSAISETLMRLRGRVREGPRCVFYAESDSRFLARVN